MATLETLRSWKSSIAGARSSNEKIIADSIEGVAKSTAPVAERIAEFRGFINGALHGQTASMNAVKQVVAGVTDVMSLKENAEKITPAEDVWVGRFNTALGKLPEADKEVAQRKLSKTVQKLAERVRVLVVWEGILEQLIVRAESAATAKPANGKPAAAPAAKQPANGAPKPAQKPATKDTGDIDLAPAKKPAPGDTGDIAAAGPDNTDGEYNLAATADEPLDDAAIAKMLADFDDDEIIGDPDTLPVSAPTPAPAAKPVAKK